MGFLRAAAARPRPDRSTGAQAIGGAATLSGFHVAPQLASTGSVREGPRMPYFDDNATTPLSAIARETWLRASDEAWQNPSSPYRDAARVRIRLEQCRETSSPDVTQA